MKDHEMGARVGEGSPPAPWWSFATPQRVSFGAGCRWLLGDVLQEFGTRVLVCTDRNLVEAGAIAPLLEELSHRGYEVLVFDEGEAEIGFEGAESCVERVRSFEPTVVDDFAAVLDRVDKLVGVSEDAAALSACAAARGV